MTRVTGGGGPVSHVEPMVLYIFSKCKAMTLWGERDRECSVQCARVSVGSGESRIGELSSRVFIVAVWIKMLTNRQSI